MGVVRLNYLANYSLVMIIIEQTAEQGYGLVTGHLQRSSYQKLLDGGQQYAASDVPVPP